VAGVYDLIEVRLKRLEFRWLRRSLRGSLGEESRHGKQTPGSKDACPVARHGFQSKLA
jgi:hypothetical protein